MAPLDPANTVRYYLDYEGPMGKRTMQFRTNGLQTDEAVASAIVSFLNPLRSVIYDTVIFSGLRKSAAGSNVSNPVPWQLLTGSQTGVLAPTVHPRYISFIGRSRQGRRVRIYVYGTSLAVTDDYRINFSESSAVQSAVASLNSEANMFVSIDNLKPVWKLYANHGYNAYHQRKKRNVA